MAISCDITTESDGESYIYVVFMLCSLMCESAQFTVSHPDPSQTLCSIAFLCVCPSILLCVLTTAAYLMSD